MWTDSSRQLKGPLFETYSSEKKNSGKNNIGNSSTCKLPVALQFEEH